MTEERIVETCYIIVAIISLIPSIWVMTLTM